jgi:hypothetical protein
MQSRSRETRSGVTQHPWRGVEPLYLVPLAQALQVHPSATGNVEKGPGVGHAVSDDPMESFGVPMGISTLSTTMDNFVEVCGTIRPRPNVAHEPRMAHRESTAA